MDQEVKASGFLQEQLGKDGAKLDEALDAIADVFLEPLAQDADGDNKDDDEDEESGSDEEIGGEESKAEEEDKGAENDKNEVNVSGAFVKDK